MERTPVDLVNVVVYSNRDEVRARVMSAVGRRPGPDLPRVQWLECASGRQVVDEIDAGEVDLLILDGEAQPTGGMGLARQFKHEISECPPIIVLVARQQDCWLASWSMADAVISEPIDPVEAGGVVAEQLRKQLTAIPVIR